jgi:Flp pilus assembly protein TadB
MADPFLLLVIRCQSAGAWLRSRMVEVWHERHDESGLDEAVTKMIWLAVGIGVAVAATAFFVSVFHNAQAHVPDPATPAP